MHFFNYYNYIFFIEDILRWYDVGKMISKLTFCLDIQLGCLYNDSC